MHLETCHHCLQTIIANSTLYFTSKELEYGTEYPVLSHFTNNPGLNTVSYYGLTGMEVEYGGQLF
jgi:hypothetical protein